MPHSTSARELRPARSTPPPQLPNLTAPARASRGRLKPSEPPEPPEVHTVCFRHFEIEEHPQTGQHRVVGYTPDPDTMRPVRDSEGPWTWPVDPVRKAKDVQALIDADRAGEAGPVPDDPEGWR